MDPQHTIGMTEREEKAWQHFEELKDILPKLLPRWWKKDFKSYVDKFITEYLNDKEFVTSMPYEDEEEEEFDRIYLHHLRHLVAGAMQEWELVQQPKHATTYAKLNGALVWQGRGCISSILCGISLLQPSLQS